MARPASDIRERVIAAARKRFLHEGVDGASLRGIAEDAGTNIGMVYYYFKAKDELLLAVVEDVYVELLAELERIFGGEQPLAKKLEALYAHIAQLSDRELDVLRLIMREALVSSERLTQLAERFGRGHVPLVLRALAQGVAVGELDAEQHPAVLLVATFALAIVPQLMHRRVHAAGLEVAKLLPSREQVAQAFTRVLWGGIGAREGAPDIERRSRAARSRHARPGPASKGPSARRPHKGASARRG